MTGAQTTRYVIVAVVLLVGVWDLAALTFWGGDASISRVMLRGGTTLPAIPFALGFVFGHIFWSQRLP